MKTYARRGRRRAILNTAGRLLVGLAGFLPAIWCHAIHFTEIARFDLSFATDPGTAGNISASYIGNLPMAVAWNGEKLYVAGFDLRDHKAVHGATNGPISIIEILDATNTGVIASPTLGSRFGTITTSPNDRGYIALELKGDLLAAANDQGGNSPNAIQLFDTADNSLKWNLSASSQSLRGAGGVTFDPGYPAGDPALGSGIAYSLLGSGRRALLKEADGAKIYDTTDGFAWLPGSTPAPHNPRDMAFDPETGDIFVIRNGRVHRADRTGDNEVTNPRVIVDLAPGMEEPSADNGQHLEFMETAVGGDLIIYNDVSPAGVNVDAPFSDHVKVIDPEGNQQEVSFGFIGGGDPPAGDARYDFDFDSLSQTLAVLDSFNRSISIFQLGATPSLLGDFNNDLAVDGLDLIKWQGDFGVTGGSDADGDNDSDGRDLLIWQQHLGNVSASANAAATPEPGGLVLALTAAALLGLRRGIRPNLDSPH